MKHCMICFSKYRDEISVLFKKGVSRRFIYEKYGPLMEYKAQPHSFEILLARHFKNHKKNDEVIVPQGIPNLRHTLDSIADRFTDLMGKKLETMTEKDVSVKDYALAQKVVVESKKLKLSENAMMIQLAQIFGPRIIEGEEIYGTRSLKDPTDKPANP